MIAKLKELGVIAIKTINLKGILMKLLPKFSALACTLAIAGSAYAEKVELTLIDCLLYTSDAADD